MEQSNTYYSTGYDPVNDPIMDPEYQLPARTSRFGPATLAPVAMLGLGIAGAAAYVLTRRKKEQTFSERVLSMLEDRYDDVKDFAHDDLIPAAETARKRGFKLFKRGSKIAGKAAADATDFAQEQAQAAAETGAH